MIISNNLSSKRILVIFGALVISLVLIIAQHDPVWAVARASTKFIQREVWHHSQTVGILVFHGGQRTLLECQLILIEGTR